MNEILIASAISLNGRTYVGKRHNHAMDNAQELGNENDDFTRKAIQGFITNKLRFVNREEGRIIAESAKQIINRHCLNETTIYSENLW